MNDREKWRERARDIRHDDDDDDDDDDDSLEAMISIQNRFYNFADKFCK